MAVRRKNDFHAIFFSLLISFPIHSISKVSECNFSFNFRLVRMHVFSFEISSRLRSRRLIESRGVNKILPSTYSLGICGTKGIYGFRAVLV